MKLRLPTFAGWQHEENASQCIDYQKPVFRQTSARFNGLTKTILTI